MAEPRTAILHRDGSLYYYGNYADAGADASSPNRDTIVIYADLDEPIVLKDKVDIWIYPGVVVDMSSAGVTITDNNTAVICNIYGMGIIKNSYNSGTDPTRYECIKTSNEDTELSVECDYIQGIGGRTVTSIVAASIHISKGKKFHLTCNKVYNERTSAIYIGSAPNNPVDYVDDININVQTIEIGSTTDTLSESIAIATLGSGFIKVDQIICRHYGHCLLHAGGNITASIRKMTGVNNINFNGGIIIISHGEGTQQLILYFDEIEALKTGSANSNQGILMNQGTGILIGRRISSIDSNAMEIVGTNTKGYVKCNELISENHYALGVNDFTNKIIFDVNYIQGNSSGVVFAYRSVNFELKNAKIRNLNSDLPSRVISINRDDGVTPKVTLNNVKLITGNDTTTEIIYSAEFDPPNDPVDADIDNYGLFVNVPINDDFINLFIGDNSNFLYIDSSDLT